MPIQVGRYDVVIRNKPETPAAVWVVGSFVLMVALAAVLGMCGSVGVLALAGHAPTAKTEAAMDTSPAPVSPAPGPVAKKHRSDGETSYHELR